MWSAPNWNGVASVSWKGFRLSSEEAPSRQGTLTITVRFGMRQRVRRARIRSVNSCGKRSTTTGMMSQSLSSGGVRVFEPARTSWPGHGFTHFVLQFSRCCGERDTTIDQIEAATPEGSFRCSGSERFKSSDIPSSWGSWRRLRFQHRERGSAHADSLAVLGV
jgi:hypothetical protein